MLAPRWRSCISSIRLVRGQASGQAGWPRHVHRRRAEAEAETCVRATATDQHRKAGNGIYMELSTGRMMEVKIQRRNDTASERPAEADPPCSATPRVQQCRMQHDRQPRLDADLALPVTTSPRARRRRSPAALRYSARARKFMTGLVIMCAHDGTGWPAFEV
jgi:hypothetical protein